MDEQFLTAAELRQVADVCEFLNDKVVDLGFEPFGIFDTNGEIVGYIACGSGGYAYHLAKPAS